MGVSLVPSFFRIRVIARCPCDVHNLPLRFLRKQTGGHCGSLKKTQHHGPDKGSQVHFWWQSQESKIKLRRWLYNSVFHLGPLNGPCSTYGGVSKSSTSKICHLLLVLLAIPCFVLILLLFSHFFFILDLKIPDSCLTNCSMS